jgi:hypothetical protein
LINKALPGKKDNTTSKASLRFLKEEKGAEMARGIRQKSTNEGEAKNNGSD